MKILYVITRAVHGGAQKQLLDLVGGLPPDVEAVVACGEGGFLEEGLRGTRARFVRLNWLVRPVSPLADLRGVRELRALIRRERPDIVHAHSSKAGIVARVAGASLGIPTVFTAHGFAFQTGLDGRLRTVALASERICGPLSAHIITVSNADHRLADRVHLARPDRISTVWNGVPDTARRADPGRSPVRVTMVARFDDPKDQATLLSAAAQVTGRLELVFVGDGPTRATAEAQARSLGLPSVAFLGTRDDIEDLLADAQVFALTSLKEGLPLTILEAMRAGLPVVASDVGGIRECVTDGETGFLVPARGVRELAARLQSLVDDPGLRLRLGAAGRARYERDFRVETMGAKTLEIYSRVLARARRGSTPASPGSR